MPLYNVLAVFAHTIPVRREKKVATQMMMMDIITNPLILAGAAGMALSFIGFYPEHIVL
jgi:predicted permease